MIKGILFDMDGIIIDSNRIHYRNWNHVFRKRFGIDIPRDEFASRLGENSRHFTEYFLNKYNIKEDTEDVVADIIGQYRDNRCKIKLKKGIREALRRLKRKYKIALATGANREAALHTMETFGIGEYFDYIIGGDEVERAKPNPEIFLKAAQGLGIKAEECVVVEDANLGIKAAKQAGMKVIAIPDELTKDQDFTLADIIIDSAEELDDSLITKI